MTDRNETLGREIRFVVACLLLFIAAPLCAADMRYVGQFVDGTRVEGNELNGWASPGETPKVDGTELFTAKKPLRWLRDRTLAAAESEPESLGFIEFANGDHLPGRVVEYIDPKNEVKPMVAADGKPAPPPPPRDGKLLPPPHLGVAIDVPASLPNSHDVPGRLRVLPQFIRRIVWGTPSSRPLEPGTMLLRDGRRLTFRSLRWQGGNVRFLGPEGIRQVALSDLAEIRFARTDPWQDYCDELALAEVQPVKRIVRVETSLGLIVSAAESAARPAGFGGDRKSWAHTLRPVWSLDPLWVPVLSVCEWSYFAPHELPAWRWPPVRFVVHPLLGRGWPWQMDRNVEGGVLAGARGPYGWGIGVHAPCELWFDVPPLAESFRVHAGLDRLAGTGGCARAVIYRERPEGRPLFQSKHLIGSTELADGGVIPLGGRSGKPAPLILVADAADADRPAGADPFDIRDTLDWVEPMFLLDATALQSEVQKRVSAKPR